MKKGLSTTTLIVSLVSCALVLYMFLVCEHYYREYRNEKRYLGINKRKEFLIWIQNALISSSMEYSVVINGDDYNSLESNVLMNVYTTCHERDSMRNYLAENRHYYTSDGFYCVELVLRPSNIPVVVDSRCLPPHFRDPVQTDAHAQIVLAKLSNAQIAFPDVCETLEMLLYDPTTKDATMTSVLRSSLRCRDHHVKRLVNDIITLHHMRTGVGRSCP